MGNNIFSYTNRSLENSRREGMKKIPIVSRGDWTDLNPTDPGMIILDYVHALVDMINFYQDHQALESFISTAKERKNIFRLAKQLSYNIRSAKGAVVDLEFYIDGIHSETVVIPRNTSVSTESGIEFLTTEDAYIPVGELSVTVPAVQGKLTIDTYIGTGISRFSNTPNAVDQTHTLLGENIDIDSIEIVDSLSRVWSPVDYIVFSTENDRVYQADLNYDGSITIKFGNGERGIVPGDTDYLYITYMETLADEGRAGAGTIVNIRGNLYDIIGTRVDVHVINRESTAGGSKPPEDEEITELAPGNIKAQNRAVTLKDFENLAKTIDGVSDAIAYDINKAPDLCLYHEVKVLIVPDIGTTLNSSLVKRVYDFLYQRMIPPTNLQVLAPSEVVVDLNIVLVRDRTGIVEGGIEYAVRESVKEYFDNRYGAVGVSFNPNELVGILNSVQGVQYVEKISPSETIKVDPMSVVRLGKLNISII